jgi:hypothetical protein
MGNVMNLANQFARSLPSLAPDIDGWGYYLLPPAHPSSPGGSGLIVALRAVPTGKHFDPEKILLHAQGMHGQPELVQFTRKPPTNFQHQVCVGDIQLVDRKNKSVDLFMFGGSLDAAEHTAETIYSLTSSAPIVLLVSNTASVQDQFVAEVLLEFSTLHARSRWSESEFKHQLAALEPFTLYSGVVHDLWRKYSSSNVMQRTSPVLYRMLAHEVEWLSQHCSRQEWGPSLESLLTAHASQPMPSFLN